MAPLEQQWVKVQQKTFTKWCAPRLQILAETEADPRPQAEQQTQKPQRRDQRPDY
jgi:hypothetical protein